MSVSCRFTVSASLQNTESKCRIIFLHFKLHPNCPQNKETLHDHGIARDSQANQVQYMKIVSYPTSIPSISHPESCEISTTMASRETHKQTKSSTWTISHIQYGPQVYHFPEIDKTNPRCLIRPKRMVSNGETSHSSRGMKISGWLFFLLMLILMFMLMPMLIVLFTPTGPWENPANSNWVLGKNHDQACSCKYRVLSFDSSIAHVPL